MFYNLSINVVYENQVFKCFIICTFCVLYVYAHARVYHNIGMEVRGQFTRVDSHLPLCESLEIKIRWSGLWQTPLPTEPSD